MFGGAVCREVFFVTAIETRWIVALSQSILVKKEIWPTLFPVFLGNKLIEGPESICIGVGANAKKVLIFYQFTGRGRNVDLAWINFFPIDFKTFRDYPVGPEIRPRIDDCLDWKD